MKFKLVEKVDGDGNEFLHVGEGAERKTVLCLLLVAFDVLDVHRAPLADDEIKDIVDDAKTKVRPSVGKGIIRDTLFAELLMVDRAEMTKGGNGNNLRNTAASGKVGSVDDTDTLSDPLPVDDVHGRDASVGLAVLCELRGRDRGQRRGRHGESGSTRQGGRGRDRGSGGA